MTERLSYAGLLLLVALGGGLAWSFSLGNRLDPDPSALASVPFEVDGWSGADVPVESDVEAMLRADYNLQRAYESPDGGLVWVYVGYYGTRRGGRPEHTPPTCYEANGYRILEERTIPIDPASGLRVRELFVEMEGERRLAHFWYRARGRTGILDGLGISLERLRRRFDDGRGDAALLRVSTVVAGPDDLDAARARLAIFERFLDRAVAERWPDERPEGSAEARAQGERQTASRSPSPAR
jgi:EpsI family protein